MTFHVHCFRTPRSHFPSGVLEAHRSMKHSSFQCTLDSHLARLEQCEDSADALSILVESGMRGWKLLQATQRIDVLHGAGVGKQALLQKHVVRRLAWLTSHHSIQVVCFIVLTAATALHCMCGPDNYTQKLFLDISGALLLHGRRFVFRKHHKISLQRAGCVPKLIWLLHCVSAARGLVLICFQLRSGIRRSKHARRKLRCLPPRVAVAIRGLNERAEAAASIFGFRCFFILAAFLCVQFLIAYAQKLDQMSAIYCLMGRSATYIGRTSHSRKAELGAPLPRGHEHLFELFHTHGHVPAKKKKAFCKETAVDFSQYYLFSIPDHAASRAESIFWVLCKHCTAESGFHVCDKMPQTTTPTT